jgi:hypothetical protein
VNHQSSKSQNPKSLKLLKRKPRKKKPRKVKRQQKRRKRKRLKPLSQTMLLIKINLLQIMQERKHLKPSFPKKLKRRKTKMILKLCMIRQPLKPVMPRNLT